MQQSDINAAILKLTFGLEGFQKDLAVLKDQLRQFEASYVPNTENDLKLNALRDSIRRMENDIDGMHRQLDRLEQMIRDQEIANRERAESAKEQNTKMREDFTRDINNLVNSFKSWQLKVLLWFGSPLFLAIIGLVFELIHDYIVNIHP